MNFLSAVFGTAMIAALLTGKAYFRGVHDKQDDAGQYWTIIGCYAALALAGFVFPMLRSAGVHFDKPVASVSSSNASGDWLTDGATRLAGELEAAAASARASADGRVTLEHRPKARPDGCADDYKVQFSRASALVIWCSTNGHVTASHTTTSHLRAVDVPQTFIVDKGAGETLRVELERQGSRVVVTGVE